MLSFLLLGEAPAAASSPQPLVPGERQCNTPSAEPVTDELDADGRPRWSRFYSVKDVCLAIRPEACGMRLDVGFGQDSDDFDPLHALRQWVDLFEAGCGGTPLEAVRKAGTGVALTVQHINTYNQDSLQHQAASLLAMYADADKDMQTRLARTTSVVLPQYSSRVQLRELQLLELTVETNYELAKLRLADYENEDEAEAMMKEAEQVHEAAMKEYKKLRAQLPTTLRKLTAGYELRTYWFEIFE